MSPSFVKHRLELALARNGTPVPVYWSELEGGTTDPLTGAVVGGVETPVSGVIRAFGAEEPPRAVLRQYQEIQAGDLILDVADNAYVTLPDGSTVLLDDLSGKGVRLEWGGQLYVQKEIGEDLASAWNVIVQGQRIGRTLLLRRAT